MSIYGRLLGQAVTLLTHSANSVVMLLSMQNKELLKDTEIRNMTSKQHYYLTVWNVGFQLVYFSLAFICDFLTLLGKDHLMLKGTNKFRLYFFSNIVFPISTVIFVIFWPFFLTNRELLFPAFIDKIFSFESNLVIHFFIFPAVLWELAFLPRKIPKSHRRNVTAIILFCLVYLCVICYSYMVTGFFPYPIMDMIVGTIFFPIAVLLFITITVSIYYWQWNLTTFIWKNNIKPPKESKKSKIK